MKKLLKQIERLLGFGGIKKDIAFLAVSGLALAASIFHWPHLPFDAAWIADYSLRDSHCFRGDYRLSDCF